MQDAEKIVYKLYAMTLSQDAEEKASNYPFCRITPFYWLIYTADAQPTGSIEIADSDLDCLSSADRDWLLGCNIALIAEDAKKREKEISAMLSEKIELLEQALEEAKKQGGK